MIFLFSMLYYCITSRVDFFRLKLGVICLYYYYTFDNVHYSCHRWGYNTVRITFLLVNFTLRDKGYLKDSSKAKQGHIFFWYAINMYPHNFHTVLWFTENSSVQLFTLILTEKLFCARIYICYKYYSCGKLLFVVCSDLFLW